MIECYSKPSKHYPYEGITLDPYPELYAVRWDNGMEGKGYLPHGLIAEEQN